jgi:hypothetical protein
MSTDLATIIRSRCPDQSIFQIGQFRFIGLNATGQFSTDGRCAIREDAFQQASHHILGLLKPTDLLLRCRDGFLVVYEQTDENRSETKTDTIARSLNSSFQADAVLSTLSIQAESREVQRGDLSSVLAKVLGIEKTLRDVGPAEPTPQRLDPVAASDRYWQFLPIWDSRRNAFATSEAVARASINGREYFGREVLQGNTTAKDHMQLDLQALNDVTAEITRLTAEGASIAACIPLHIDGLTGSMTGERYLDLLKTIAPNQKAIQLSIEGITSSTPERRIVSAITPLVALGYNITLCVPLTTKKLAGIARMGIKNLGARWPDEGGPLQTQFLGSLIDLASEYGLPTTLYGINSREVFEFAYRAGVRSMSGPGVAKMTASALPRQAATYKQLIDGDEY